MGRRHANDRWLDGPGGDVDATESGHRTIDQPTQTSARMNPPSESEGRISEASTAPICSLRLEMTILKPARAKASAVARPDASSRSSNKDNLSA